MLDAAAKQKRKNGKSTLQGSFQGISEDGKTVKLNSRDGIPKRPAIKDLGQTDQGLVRGLVALPDKVTLDTKGLAEKSQQKWLEGVISDFGRLNELPKGKDLLERIKRSPNNGTVESRDDADGVGNRVKFTSGPRGAKDVTVSYSPTDTKGWKADGGRGDPTRPPFLALGKELWTGERAAKAPEMPETMQEERDSANFENMLRDKWNATLPAGAKRLPHRGVPVLK